MQSKIYLLFLILLLTGCSATYELKIEENTVEENINMHIDTSKIKTPQTMADISEIEKNEISPLIEENHKYYQKEINRKDSKTHIQLAYQYTIEEFKKSRVLHQCFNHFIFLDNENNYYIKLYGGYQCDFGEEYNVKIKIKTNHKVLQNNADSTGNNTYIWDINKTNAKNKELYFQVSKKEKQVEKKENGNVLIMTAIAITITALAIFIIYIVVQKILGYRFRR